MKGTKRRLLALLLALTMALGMFPMSAMATDGTAPAEAGEATGSFNDGKLGMTIYYSEDRKLDKSADTLIKDAVFEADTVDGTTTITVTLPQSIKELNDEAAASRDINKNLFVAFDIEQNESGEPFVSAKSNQKKTVTEMRTPMMMSLDAGLVTVYWFASETAVSEGVYDTYQVKYKFAEPNNPPTLAEGVTSTEEDTVQLGESWSVDLSKIFTDEAVDTLIYNLKINGDTQRRPAANYTYTPAGLGTVTLEFVAMDLTGQFSKPYTVTLTVESDAHVIPTGDTGGDHGGVITNILIGNKDDVEASAYAKLDDIYRVAYVQLKDNVVDNAEIKIDWINDRSDSVTLTPEAIKLENGKATAEIETSGNHITKKHYYTIYLSKEANSAPVLADGDNESDEETAHFGTAYQLDLSEVFIDAEGHPMTYTVSIDGGEAEEAGENYRFTATETGDYTLVFQAKDYWYTSEQTYTVNLTVKNSDTTYDVTVKVPDAVTPTFYSCTAFDENGVDVLGDALTAAKGNSANGWTSYTVKVPENVNRVSFRGVEGDTAWGGMSFEAARGMEPVILRQVNATINTDIDSDGGKVPVTAQQAVFKVKYGDDMYAVTGGSSTDSYGYPTYRFLLIAADNSLVYTYYSEPVGDLENRYSTAAGNTKTVTTEASAPVKTVLPLALRSPMTVTAPSGATVVMYSGQGYFKYAKIPAAETKDNGDGTKSVTFNNVPYGSIFRVSMKDKITKAGYVHTGMTEITVDWDGDVRTPTYRADYDPATLLGARGDDSMYVNVNYRNNLQLDVDETFQLRAYRIWEIINTDTQNRMIEPDFNYNIISGSDVIGIAPTDDVDGIAGKSWLDITAKKEGTAILEVTYDAIHIVSDNGNRDDFIVNTNNFTFNASDPARTALIVVQVGAAENDINFGFKLGRTEAWDVEFDTLYFTGDNGQIQFKPTVISGRGSVSKVEVSSNKGARYTELTADEDGYYTADIVSGNNIIRVTKTDGSEHYQIVRGDKITVTISEVAGTSNQNGVIEAGEQIDIKFNGVHNVVGKMAGIYNPAGYKTNFTFNGEAVYGDGGQYTYPTYAHVKVTIPGDAQNSAEYTLTNGYTTNGGWGSSAGKHRAVAGEVPPNLDAEDVTNHGRNIFPDITLTVGGETTAKVPAESVTLNTDSASVEVGKTVTLTATVAPANASDKTVTWSSDNTAVATVSSSGKVAGISEGTVEITATIGDYSDTCTVTVTEVVDDNTPGENPELEFGLSQDEILGYVTVSFVDKGVRKSEELNDPNATYPILPEFRNPLGTIIPATRVPFKAYDTIASVTLRLLEEKGFYADYEGDEYSSFYLAAIGDFTHRGTYYESFGEFDAGQDSGWMITWDEWFINKGASEFMVKNGDVIEWQYTCQLGRDIGDDYFEREDSATDTTTKEEEQKPSASLTPEASTNSKGEASVEIKKDELTSAVEEATKNNTAGEVVIAPEIKGDASKVTVELPKEAVDSMATSGKTDLTVKTDIATVTLPADTLKELPTDGKTVSVAVEKEEDKIKVEVAVDDKAVDKIGSGVVASIPAKDVSATSVLVIVDAEGNETIVKKSAVADGEITALLEGSCTVVVKDNKKEFTDTEGHWGKAAAEFASSRELFNGVGNGQFGMNTTMNRAMMATVFYNLENGPDHDGEHDFHDVHDHKYYAKPAAWAADHGVLSGYTDGSFRPDAPITREQLAVMLWNYSGKPSGIKALEHSDAGNISNYAKEAMQWAVENGVMSGRANGQLDPKGAATRAEVAQMFKNYIEKVVL